jgi:hypothetical protein
MDTQPRTVHLPYAEVDPMDLTAEQILAQMEAAEKAPDPNATTSGVNAIVHSGDENSEIPIQMRVAALKSAGYTYVYHRVTGERSLVNRNMLPAQLRKPLPPDEGRRAGEPAFSITRPAVPPRRGTITCLLHPEGERRAEFDAMGLPTCRKATITSEFQLRSHMKSKHPSSWKAIEEKRERQEKDEDRALQRAFIAAATAPAPAPGEAPRSARRPGADTA